MLESLKIHYIMIFLCIQLIKWSQETNENCFDFVTSSLHVFRNVIVQITGNNYAS